MNVVRIHPHNEIIFISIERAEVCDVQEMNETEYYHDKWNKPKPNSERQGHIFSLIKVPDIYIYFFIKVGDYIWEEEGTSRKWGGGQTRLIRLYD